MTSATATPSLATTTETSLARAPTSLRADEKEQQREAAAGPTTTATSLVSTHHHAEGTTTLSRQTNIFLGQTAAAVIASSAVSPAMTIIDLSIIRAQFQKTNMVTAIRGTTSDLLSGRMRWNPALNIMGTVYASTYLTANYTAAACNEIGIDYKIPTAVMTSLVNVTAIAWKDREFARMCSKTPSVFPLASYGLFAMRDGLTVTSSFVLKNDVRDRLVNDHGMSTHNADLAASFAVPMIAQLFSAPLHILSLDLYSHPNSPFRKRMIDVRKAYMSVASGRVMRVIPAFGVGSYLNDKVKEKWAEHHGYNK